MISLNALHAGSENYQQGETLFRRGSVSFSHLRSDALCYAVGTLPEQLVSFYRTGLVSCTCGADDEPCAHIAAAFLLAEGDGQLKRFRQQSETELGQSMLSVLGRAMPNGDSVRLAAMLRLYPDGRAGLGFRRTGALVRGQKRCRSADLLFAGRAAQAVRKIHLPPHGDALFQGGRAAADRAGKLYPAPRDLACPMGGARNRRRAAGGTRSGR